METVKFIKNYIHPWRWREMTVVSLELPGNAAIDIKLICAKLVEDQRFTSVGVFRKIIEHYI